MQHWLSAEGRTIHVPFGTITSKKDFIKVYDPMSGEYWWAVDNGHGAPVEKWRAGKSFTQTTLPNGGGVVKRQVRELVYTEEQYELIGWALWRMDNGWTPQETFQVLRLFWTVERGQTPLTWRTLIAWRRTRSSMQKKGLIWP